MKFLKYLPNTVLEPLLEIFNGSWIGICVRHHGDHFVNFIPQKCEGPQKSEQLHIHSFSLILRKGLVVQIDSNSVLMKTLVVLRNQASEWKEAPQNNA